MWPAAAVCGMGVVVWLAASTAYTMHVLGVTGLLLIAGGLVRLKGLAGKGVPVISGVMTGRGDDAARLDAIAGMASEWFWQTDAELRFTYISARLRDLLGLDPGELIGRRFDDLRVAADGLPEWRVLVDDMRAGRRINGCRLALLDGSGAPRAQRLKAQPVLDGDGTLTGYCGVGADLSTEAQADQRLKKRDDEIRDQAQELRLAQERLAAQAAHLGDVTEKLTMARDKTRQAEDSLAALGIFLGHEVRSSMNGILGMSGLLLRTKLDAAQEHYVRSSQEAGEELVRLTDDMIDLSNIEAGALAFEISDLAVADLVDDAVSGLRRAAKEKQIELVSAVAADLPDGVRGDAGRLTQILRSLVGHAIQNGEQGIVTVSAAAEQEWVGGAVLTFEVTESGNAFSAAERSGLLNPSSGLGAVAPQLGNGGIKLIMCQKLIAAMNGEAGVKARDDRSDTFWFRLPVSKHGATGAAGDEVPGGDVQGADEKPAVTPTADPDRSAA